MTIQFSPPSPPLLFQFSKFQGSPFAHFHVLDFALSVKSFSPPIQESSDSLAVMKSFAFWSVTEAMSALPSSLQFWPAWNIEN